MAAIEQVICANEMVDQRFLSHYFCKIARMPPGVWDIIVATLANRLAGLGKIAEKAKANAR